MKVCPVPHKKGPDPYFFLWDWSHKIFLRRFQMISHNKMITVTIRKALLKKNVINMDIVQRGGGGSAACQIFWGMFSQNIKHHGGGVTLGYTRVILGHPGVVLGHPMVVLGNPGVIL